MNYESESDSETTSGGGGCKSGAADDGGGLVDVEDIGVVMGKAKESKDEVWSIFIVRSSWWLVYID